MGNNFLLQQVKNFKKARDRAKAEQVQPKLFQRPELLNTVYPGKPAEEVTFENGEDLFAVASKNDQHIDLARGHRRVGRTDGDAAKELLDALREPGVGGVVKVKVVDSKPFMNAVNRQAFDRAAGRHPWRPCPTQNGQPFDNLLAQNLAGYAAWIEQRGSVGGKKNLRPTAV